MAKEPFRQARFQHERRYRKIGWNIATETLPRVVAGYRQVVIRFVTQDGKRLKGLASLPRIAAMSEEDRLVRYSVSFPPVMFAQIDGGSILERLAPEPVGQSYLLRTLGMEND